MQEAVVVMRLHQLDRHHQHCLRQPHKSYLVAVVVPAVMGVDADVGAGAGNSFPVLAFRLAILEIAK